MISNSDRIIQIGPVVSVGQAVKLVSSAPCDYRSWMHKCDLARCQGVRRYSCVNFASQQINSNTDLDVNKMHVFLSR